MLAPGHRDSAHTNFGYLLSAGSGCAPPPLWGVSDPRALMCLPSRGRDVQECWGPGLPQICTAALCVHINASSHGGILFCGYTMLMVSLFLLVLPPPCPSLFFPFLPYFLAPLVFRLGLAHFGEH